MTESETKNVSTGVKSSPFMIPKESPPRTNTFGAARSVSPTDGISESLSNKSVAGGWVRPKDTNSDDADRTLDERVWILSLNIFLIFLNFCYIAI